MKTVHRVIGLTLMVFVAALALRLAGAGDRPMHPDEYYTILAARSLAAEGVPRIGDGQAVACWPAPGTRHGPSEGTNPTRTWKAPACRPH